MLNQNAAWKWIVLLAVVVIGGLYAAPNVFGEDPAVKVTRENSKADNELLRTVERTLADAKLVAKSLELTDTGIEARFNNTDEQFAAAKAIEKLAKQRRTDDVQVGLALMPKTPAWLEGLGAKPMSLGLDLRGGVHFLMEVDLAFAEEKSLVGTAQVFEDALRDKRLRLKGRSTFVERVGGSFVLHFAPQRAAQLEEMLAVFDEEVEDLVPFDAETSALSDDEKALARNIRGNVYALTLERRETLRKRAIEQNQVVLRQRVNSTGVAEPLVQQQGKTRIVVQVPGAQDPAKLKELLGGTATLEYRMVFTDGDARSNRVPAGAKKYYRRDGSPILLNKKVIATGANLVDAVATTDQYGAPAVSVTLDGEGASRMGKNTAENIGKPMAVVLIEFLPEVVEKSGEKETKFNKVETVISVATIQGQFSKRFQTTGLSPGEAPRLAKQLRSGALVAPVFIVEERTIGPSMGQENIDKGLMSVLIGLALVVAFMVGYYRAFGFVANLALALNLVVIVAVMSLFGATLTLPGIAGIVLTVGMAVDANVLIFERIREELRAGSKIQAAINAGYEKAFSTIADANVTTLIAALVLMAMGNGPVKGFAVTLAIGIATSMFTAIFGTRVLVNALYGARNVAKISIGGMGFIAKELTINFMSKRKLAGVFSLLLIVASIGSLATQKLNFGIDFTGGVLVEVGYEESADLSKVRAELAEAGFDEAITQHFGSSTDVLVRLPPLEVKDGDAKAAAEASAKLSNAIFAAMQKAGEGAALRRVEFVGPQVGDELTEKGGLALLFALGAILIYVALRFEYRFGLGSVAALVHDVIITLGVFSIFQIEFNLTVLAALLAVIGYSLNDTIVVFDRIRENFIEILKGTPEEVANKSINQTLGRTLMTSITTLLVLAALLFLGGEVISGFAMALIVGVLVGTYSSIFVASSAALALGVTREGFLPVEKEGADQEDFEMP